MINPERFSHEERIAYEAGRVAFCAGFSVADCPHVMNTPEFDFWCLGLFVRRAEAAKGEVEKPC